MALSEIHDNAWHGAMAMGKGKECASHGYEVVSGAYDTIFRLERLYGVW